MEYGGETKQPDARVGFCRLKSELNRVKEFSLHKHHQELKISAQLDQSSPPSVIVHIPTFRHSVAILTPTVALPSTIALPTASPSTVVVDSGVLNPPDLWLLLGLMVGIEVCKGVAASEVGMGDGGDSRDITMDTSETNSKSGPVNPNMQHSGGTMYATPYVAPAHGSVGLGERPKKFNGKDFKRWQQKMLFYLTTLNLARFLQEDTQDLGENPDRPMVNAKALWESLERKYKTEDVGSKKFIVGKFFDFKMVDSKTVICQVQEFQLILHDIHAEGMVLGEFFQVAALIEKLPPTWKDFKN
ncbi:hypothetical protein RJ639_036488 [Escallonia herrerae]|uniref:Uncharacterized protein n=1 Tax=Escallonia herrerae TaxID=1293975 RepID=A0AA88WU25_9ASTE|nr:hypothetical protein RJ639_036488 [Escallonia herrerae]